MALRGAVLPSRVVRYRNFAREFERDLEGAGLQFALDLVARQSLWVRSEVARAVEVVYPKTAREPPGSRLQGKVRDGIRLFTNQPAQSAVFRAMGSDPRHFTGYGVCHIYPGSPYDPRHFTRLANLIVVPEPLADFTEWRPVLEALKWRAFELYGYKGPAGVGPARPSQLPRRWPAPRLVGPRRLPAVLRDLRHLRATRPMYQSPGGEGGPRETIVKSKEARALDAQFWQAVLQTPGEMEAVVGWFVGQARFAPEELVVREPNPFYKTRRAHWGEHLRKGEFRRGVAIVDNTPSARALFVALGLPVTRVRGAIVDHIWPEAAFLAAHNARLAGLVLLPQPLGKMADSRPVRAMLQRRAFERTGYKGPLRSEPDRVPWSPARWPEIVALDGAALERAAQKLRAYRLERPTFYPPRK